MCWTLDTCKNFYKSKNANADIKHYYLDLLVVFNQLNGKGWTKQLFPKFKWYLEFLDHEISWDLDVTSVSLTREGWNGKEIVLIGSMHCFYNTFYG